MAQRVTLLLVDDLDGGAAQLTVAFALDGQRYEIDLSTANDRLLRAALEPFVAAARRTARPTDGTRRTGTRRRRPANGTAPSGSDETPISEAPPPEPAPQEPAEPEPAPPTAPKPAAVPPARFSSPPTHPATRLGAATRPGSVEIFTHRA